MEALLRLNTRAVDTAITGMVFFTDTFRYLDQEGRKCIADLKIDYKPNGTVLDAGMIDRYLQNFEGQKKNIDEIVQEIVNAIDEVVSPSALVVELRQRLHNGYVQTAMYERYDEE